MYKANLLKQCPGIQFRHMAIALLFLLPGLNTFGQPAYFPPATGTEWETTTPASLNWCPEQIDSLYNFLEAQHSKAFILLVDGRIVLEQYFNGHTATSNWYWASAGKTLTSFMVGLAQQDGYLSISDTSSKYLGRGWTGCTPEQEEKITIRHQLTMTTGLDDGVPNVDCTLDSCLVYKADPGTRWAYHNAPYTLLDSVVHVATGNTLNKYVNQKLQSATGIKGIYVPVDYKKVFYSTARSMARFGLLVQNRGVWNTTPVMTDSIYLNDMINTSQDLNKSYGYLWWLNGKESYMAPSLQTTFPGTMMPNAPADAVMALGKNGQFINVVPSRNMVFIRMGDSPDSAPVPFFMNDQIWEYINRLECIVTVNNNGMTASGSLKAPSDLFTSKIDCAELVDGMYVLLDMAGRTVWTGKNIGQQNFTSLTKGIYLLQITDGNGEQTVKMIKH